MTRVAGMMRLVVAGGVVLAAGCSQEAPPPPQAAVSTTAEPVTLVDRVWKVAESTGMTPGQLVVFLSDSTLVFASPQAEPAFGTWGYVAGSLTMVEEGIPYAVEVLELTARELRIRSHNPGAPVETRFVRADRPDQAAAKGE
jgi:hypothetical protein